MRRRLRKKGQCPATDVPKKPDPIPAPKKDQCPDAKKPAAHVKKTAADTPSGNDKNDGKRLCGNCGFRGHQAVTCTMPCFACGGDHKYFECDHHDSKRQANRNRVQWKGYGSCAKEHKSKGGMKESGAGKFWVRTEYDPEYTPKRDISPKRAALDKCPHASDRCRTALRS